MTSVYVLGCLSVASDWGCNFVCNSYAPGLAHSVGRSNTEMDYVEMMSQGELPSIDENLSLDQLNNFGFTDFMQSYDNKPQ